MRFETSAKIDAPVERVWAWWTDFGRAGEAKKVDHGIGTSQRRIVRAEADVVVFEDRSLLGKVTRTVRLQDGHRLHETGEGAQVYESEWRFEPEGEAGTRVTRTMRIRAHPVLGPFARLITQRDLEHHCREAEKALKSTRAG